MYWKGPLLAIFFIFSTIYVTAQLKPTIRNLVFEGAGIRGIAYCGVVRELEAKNLLQPVEKVGGTSSGAIVALTISLGYSSRDIEEIITGTNFQKFNDGNYFFIGGVNRTNKYFGWYRGDRFENWLEKIISRKTGNADITFEELHRKGFKDLYITGTCLNKQQLIVFSRDTYPRMKVKDAVRISMSIPLYFEAVFIDKDGQVVRHPRQKNGLDVMVDGGFTGNFPIRMFDSSGRRNFSTVGFRIDTDDQIRSDQEGKDLAPLPVDNFKQYMNAFYNIIIENLNRQQLTTEDWQRTISISDGNIKPRIRKLSSEEINTLIANGRKAAAGLSLQLPFLASPPLGGSQ
jgi:NTE family protein